MPGGKEVSLVPWKGREASAEDCRAALRMMAEGAGDEARCEQRGGAVTFCSLSQRCSPPHR